MSNPQVPPSEGRDYEFWVNLLLRNMPLPPSAVILGGSSGRRTSDDRSDIDLFVTCNETDAFRVATDVYRALHRMPILFVSTVEYRRDYGFRVRASSDLLQSCSFFFSALDTIRNVEDRRRGRVIQGTRPAFGPKDRDDCCSRSEELAVGLLEIPAVAKHLTRGDHTRARIRLYRLNLALTNYATLDPARYLAGSDHLISDRLQGIGLDPDRVFGDLAGTLTEAVALVRICQRVAHPADARILAFGERHLARYMLIGDCGVHLGQEGYIRGERGAVDGACESPIV